MKSDLYRALNNLDHHVIQLAVFLSESGLELCDVPLGYADTLLTVDGMFLSQVGKQVENVRWV